MIFSLYFLDISTSQWLKGDLSMKYDFFKSTRLKIGIFELVIHNLT